MNKLQVRHGEDELGDEDDELRRESEEEDEDFYGPKVSFYGPEIPSRVQPAGYEEEGD